ncbi:hypothetical protein SISSUDRAFT_1055428 [Sistotremastrum suecicum HHB10207 ss-3]|uniref:Uncharacterized protein n=1 Tax=Sistotremastrum suecicum HHB10207 ss-3 TaxID=1314776 RepID=A0A165XT24_9AGAM|nr:hypothetical protein SISSUDRAFT_1055428 [Sistotremastrum suecicum HHB10207 ss-3]
MPFLARFLLYLVETPNKYRIQKAQREARELAKRPEVVANGNTDEADVMANAEADEEIREAEENDCGEDEVEGLTWISAEVRARLVSVYARSLGFFQLMSHV